MPIQVGVNGGGVAISGQCQLLNVCVSVGLGVFMIGSV